MEIKMFKLKEDPCYAKKYEKIPDCQFCWVRTACSVAFKNRK